jgi:hypothetical protein
MALIYRAIFDVEPVDFPSRAVELASVWARWKLAQPELVLETGTQLEDPERGIELRCAGGQDEDTRVFRTVLFEKREPRGEEVRSTFTAASNQARAWVWMDVERWTAEPDVAGGWIPFAPSLVRSILGDALCYRGPTTLESEVRVFRGDEARSLAASVVDPAREVPLVVVTPNQRAEDGLDPAETRAREINRHLMGVAATCVLGEGAVSAFSRSIGECAGPDMDVHSGAVRVYLPRAGSTRDYPGRHRYVPWRKAEGRRREVARLVVPPILSRAVELPPPDIWRAQLRGLLDRADATAGRDFEELFGLASDELSATESELESALAARRELEERIDETELSNAELLRRVDDYSRQVKFLQAKLAPFDAAAAYVEPEAAFAPEFCSDAIAEARTSLSLLVIPESVDDGAFALDEHGNQSWPQKAWTALQALNAYAEARRDGGYQGDFKTYCEQGGEVVLPTRWVGRHESEQTRNNQRFSDLRVLTVSVEVDPTGRIFMGGHIRIQAGGTPCPRIHFHDDTGGTTGKIHIGWFGDHLDSASKS